MCVEMAMDWEDKIRVYWNSPILKIIKGKEGGNDMRAFENIVIGDIQYLSKTLFVYHEIIINYSQTEDMNYVQITRCGYSGLVYRCMNLKGIRAPWAS